MRIAGRVRAGDLVCRTAAIEFVVVLPSVPGQAGAAVSRGGGHDPPSESGATQWISSNEQHLTSAMASRGIRTTETRRSAAAPGGPGHVSPETRLRAMMSREPNPISDRREPRTIRVVILVDGVIPAWSDSRQTPEAEDVVQTYPFYTRGLPS